MRFWWFGVASLKRDAFHWVPKGQPETRDFTKRCKTERPTVAIYLDELLN